MLAAQGSSCACCKRPGCPIADHDHDTGVLRGLLCRRCNIVEGRQRSGLFATSAAGELAAYLLSPPGAAFGLMWELPDWWCDSDTRAALEQGLTAYDYALAHWQERAGGIAVEQVIAKLAATEMPELNA